MTKSMRKQMRRRLTVDYGAGTVTAHPPTGGSLVTPTNKNVRPFAIEERHPVGHFVLVTMTEDARGVRTFSAL